RAPACPCAAAAGLAAPSERDVVVGSRAAEVGVLGLRAARNELRLAALGILAPAEELDGVGDHLDRLALRAVLRFPLSPLQAPVDGDRTTLREVLRAVLTLVAPDGDVEVVRLLRPLAGLVVLAAGVDGEAQTADRHAARRVPQLGVAGQVPDQDDAV